MIVLFLDIDGVFNHIIADPNKPPYEHVGYEPPHRQTADGLSLQMEQDKVFLINRIIDRHPEIKVVLSSAWRGLPRWRETMRANGFLFDFLDRTPRGKAGDCRGDEIARWIEAWDELHPDDRVERYAIVDDSSDMLGEHLPHFFRTSVYEGLTPAIANMVEWHLTYKK